MAGNVDSSNLEFMMDNDNRLDLDLGLDLVDVD